MQARAMRRAKKYPEFRTNFCLNRAFKRCKSGVTKGRNRSSNGWRKSRDSTPLWRRHFYCGGLIAEAVRSRHGFVPRPVRRRHSTHRAWGVLDGHSKVVVACRNAVMKSTAHGSLSHIRCARVLAPVLWRPRKPGSLRQPRRWQQSSASNPARSCRVHVRSTGASCSALSRSTTYEAPGRPSGSYPAVRSASSRKTAYRTPE